MLFVFFFFRLFLFMEFDEDVLDVAFLADSHGLGGCLSQECVGLSCSLDVTVRIGI